MIWMISCKESLQLKQVLIAIILIIGMLLCTLFVGSFRKWLKFFGIINLSLHEGFKCFIIFFTYLCIPIMFVAVYTGSLPHVQRSMEAFLNSAKPQPQQINFYDVCAE